MKLFFILGNQLFPLKYRRPLQKGPYVFTWRKTNGLCTYEKHHKLKDTYYFYLLCDLMQICLKKNKYKVRLL